MDLSIEEFDERKVTQARFVGIAVPMHTAIRLGVEAGRRVRALNPSCHICYFGLYAFLNADYLLETGGDSCIGGEVEASMVSLVQAVEHGDGIDVVGVRTRRKTAAPVVARLDFARPRRDGLPPLDRYTRLEHLGQNRLVGYVEASRGCKHTCLHCPITPVYQGRFFVAPKELVLQDIAEQRDAGAEHITFGDPDFLNGPRHSLEIARTLHERWPELTFNFTAKVDHLIKHDQAVRELASLGAIFVVSAVESLSDLVLGNLEKGHARADVEILVELLNDSGLALRPSLVSFTPWTTLDDYLDVLDFAECRGLVLNIDPVQYAVRLLVPPGSGLLTNPALRPHLRGLNQAMFSYEWEHPDPRMERLWREVSALVSEAGERDDPPTRTFELIKKLAFNMHGSRKPPPSAADKYDGPPPPRLTEPWFC
jgi:radical SAM superfamily enzyme YgiQ (UPF0313 family)